MPPQNKDMIAISKEIWEFVLSKKVMCTAEYRLVRLNFRADWTSRKFHIWSKWLLSPKVFQEICLKWRFPKLDLFASRACHQIPSYLSWKADSRCLATDALQQSWKYLGLLSFSPFFNDRESYIKGQNGWGRCSYNKMASATLVQLGSGIICIEPLLLLHLSNILVNSQARYKLCLWTKP